MKPVDARVLLTGACGGIGQALAQALRDAGAALLLAGRDEAALRALAQRLQAASGPGGAHAAHPASGTPPIAWHAGDLNRPQDLAALARAGEAFGTNVLVNNAGVASFGRFETLAPAHLQQVLQTNLLVPMALTQALLAHLQRQPRAQVIQVGSALGRLGLPGFAAYSASKFGLRGFSEALRRELAGSPVTVQYLGPRSTRTAFNDAAVQAYHQATATAVDDPSAVASGLLKLLRSGAAEHFIGFPESLAVRVNGAAPALLDSAFSKHRASLAGTPRPADAAAPARS